MELFREVTILCGSKRKFLTINFRSYNETIDMIKRKFGIPDGFELKVVSDHGKGNEMSIDDDEDLYRFNDSKEFIVRLLDESQQRDLTSQLGRPEAAACTSPPSYEQSVHVAKERQTTTSQSNERKVSVVSDDTWKLVNFDMNSLAKTKTAIRTKFNIVGDFDILGKMHSNEQHYDIHNDGDLVDLKEAESFLVKKRLSKEKQSDRSPAHSKALVEVQIDKTMYPVNEAPPGNSLVVRKEAANLRLDLDLYGVIRKTDVVADCLRIARYGVANNLNLSSSIGDIVTGVMTITQDTNTAVMQFRMTGGEVLEDLVSGVGFLMEHVDSVAMTKFKRIKENTKLLKDRSKAIEQKIDNERKAIIGVLDKVKQVTKGHAATKKVAYEEIQTLGKKELERRVAVAKKDTESSDARIKLHEKEIETDKERVKKVLDKEKGCGYGCRYGLCYHGWCPCLPISRSECCYRCCSGGWFCNHKHRRKYWYWSSLCHDHGVDEKRVKAEQALQQKAEEDRQKEIAERKKLREEENKAIDELQNYIKDMKLKGDQLPADLTEMALNATDGALRNLNASVQSTIHFWEKMNQHCEAMEKRAAIADNVDDMKDDLAQRETYLNSTTFKSEAVRLYAKWVALRRLCEEFDTQIKPVETSIQRSILDYPDPEEARRRIPGLKTALDKKLKLQKEELAKAAADNESIMEGEQ